MNRVDALAADYAADDNILYGDGSEEFSPDLFANIGCNAPNRNKLLRMQIERELAAQDRAADLALEAYAEGCNNTADYLDSKRPVYANGAGLLTEEQTEVLVGYFPFA